MKINRPVFAYKRPSCAEKVFSGEIFDVYQWEQELFDGTTATFEQLKRSDGAFVVPIMSDGNIMLTEQRQPRTPNFISLPGGRIESGEDPLTAAKRELAEESGLVSDNWEFWFAVQPVGKIEWVVYYFIARGCVIEDVPHPDAGEQITLRTVSFDEFISIVTTDEHFHSTKFRERILYAQLDDVRMCELRELFGAS